MADVKVEQVVVDIPLAFYEWLTTIDRDVRVHELTPHEISGLVATLATWRDDNLAGAMVSEFLPAILHGDELHQAWLTAAVHAFIDGEPIPEPVGKGAAALRASTNERNAVIEECAKVVDGHGRDWFVASDIARAIRALKDAPDA